MKHFLYFEVIRPCATFGSCKQEIRLRTIILVYHVLGTGYTIDAAWIHGHLGQCTRTYLLPNTHAGWQPSRMEMLLIDDRHDFLSYRTQ